MSFDNCPEFLRPRLRLFLSADIVGSTALKQTPFSQSKTEQRTAWFSKIQGFYFEAQRAFQAEFEELKAQEGDPALIGQAPTLWKTIGDEVLFVKVIDDHRQIVETLRCWMRAIGPMRAFIKKGNSRLDVKCTAWLAGFPFRNSEVAVEVGASSGSMGSGEWFLESGRVLNKVYENDTPIGIIVDYIGPSIDIGFRLSQFSSSRKFVISTDVAYVLSIANPGSSAKDPVFSVYYDGSQQLKGVLGGLRYPVFWLDLSPVNALERYEDGLTTLVSVDRDRLREYCNKFYSEHESYVFPPFIHSDTEQQIRNRPSWYDDDHQKLVRNFEVGNKEEQNTGQPEIGEIDAEGITEEESARLFAESLTDESSVLKVIQDMIDKFGIDAQK